MYYPVSPKTETNSNSAIDAAMNDPNRYIKIGVWVYFFLLIFEGALRKWILPSLSGPLLIVRDPLVIVLIILGFKNKIFPDSIYLKGMVYIGIISLFSAIFIGHGNLQVAMFGARILLLHFPMIFIIGSVFNKNDVVQIGKALIWLTIPMTILVTLQFYSPQTAWVNRGVGGDLNGGGFDGALGFFRPPGTFSFINGMSMFYGLVASYIFYFWLNNDKINKLLLLASTLALLAVIPMSISRSLLSMVGITFVFMLLITVRNPQYFMRILLASVGLIFILLLLSKTQFIQTPLEAFSQRFTSANSAEGGVEGVFLDRFLGSMTNGLKKSFEHSFWGVGLGAGTNVGSLLLTGEVTFLVSETEWGRVIGEIGPILGLLVIILRIGLILKISWAAYTYISKGNTLPWMLLSFGFLSILNGAWAQPTALGFAALIGGLMIAAFNDPDSIIEQK